MLNNPLTADLARQDDHDIDQILALNKAEYGASDILAYRTDFVWRCNNNPAGQAIIPVIRNRRGEVVGFIWVVPLRIRVKGKDHLAATGTNLVIHPELRRTFGYLKLMRRFERALLENNIPFHFSFVSEENYKHLQSQNSQTTFTVPWLIKPLTPRALNPSHVSQRWKRLIVRHASWLTWTLFSRKPFLRLNKEITIRANARFDENFDEFWREAKDNYPVTVIRDRAFLTWRFAAISNRNYQIFVAELGRRVLGYVVVRCAVVRGVEAGLIVDFMVANTPVGREAGLHLIAQAEAYFREQERSVAAALITPGTREHRILRDYGFRNLPSALAPRQYRFAFFVHDRSEEDFKSLSTKDWFITLADYESF